MNKQKKKGFTIVELVIVIAVIAILAAVLIPTFAGLIKKANISADTQMVRNLNTALVMAEAGGEEVDEFSEVLSAARDAGYIISNLNPTADNCYFVWESSTNQFLLVDGEENYEVIFASEEGYPAIGATWYFATSDRDVAEELKATVESLGAQVMDMYADAEDVSEALAAGGTQTLYIDESVALDKDNLLVVNDPDAKITLELGDSALNTAGVVFSGSDIIPIRVTQGEVVVNGGVISAAGQGHNQQGQICNYAVRVEPGAKATFNDTKLDLAAYKAQIKFGGEVTMNNVTINASKVGVDTTMTGDVTLNNVTIHADGKNTEYGACIWSCNYNSAAGTGHNGPVSTVTVKSGTYSAVPSATYAALYSCGGDIIIEGGTFTATSNRMFCVKLSNADITISGDATFNGKTASQLGESGLQAMTVSGKVRADGNNFVISYN